MKSLKNRMKPGMKIGMKIGMKRKTHKINRHSPKGKRVWMFRKGNLVVCYKVPFVKIENTSISGGAVSVDKSKVLDLFGKLKSQDKAMDTYIYDNKQKIADDLIKSLEQPALKSVYDSLQSDSEPDSNVVLDWVKKRKIAQEIIKSLKEKINSPEGKKIYDEQDLAKLEKVLNNEELCNSPGKLSSIASSVFDKMKFSVVNGNECEYPEVL
jgi:hypothetical protein